VVALWVASSWLAVATVGEGTSIPSAETWAASKSSIYNLQS
jgi:hypothetical protein